VTLLLVIMYLLQDETTLARYVASEDVHVEVQTVGRSLMSTNGLILEILRMSFTNMCTESEAYPMSVMVSLQLMVAIKAVAQAAGGAGLVGRVLLK
jgi:hypothetical protein